MAICCLVPLLLVTLLLNTSGSQAGGRRRGWRSRRQLCPEDYLEELGLCRHDIIRLTQTGSNNITQLCRAHMDSLDCMERILHVCSHLSHAQALSDMMDIPSLRQSMERQCPEEFRYAGATAALQDGCPSMRYFSRNFRACSEQYNHNAFHARMTRRRCRRAAEALECLDNLGQRCSRFAQIRQYSFDWVELRNKCDYPVEDDPEETGRPEPALTSSPRQMGSVPRKHEPCPPTYLEEIKLCRTLGASPLSLRAHSATALDCRTAYRELECLDDLVTRCWDQPVIQGQLHQWNPVQFRQELDAMCSQHL